MSLYVGNYAIKKYVFPSPDGSNWSKGLGFNLFSKNVSSGKVYGWKISAQIRNFCEHSCNGNFWATFPEFHGEKVSQVFA